MSEVTVTVDLDSAEEGMDGLPDGPHVEIAFDALNDTIENVTGNESLTQAQMYMEPILAANGLISHADRVQGMEGFFSKIGEGASKTWEYIKKMFKSIWEFFFKKEAPALAKATKKTVEDAKVAMDIKNIDTAKASMSKALVYVAEGTELGELRDYLKDANTKSAVEAVGAKIARKNERARKSLSLKVGNLIETCKAAIALTEQSKTAAAKHEEKELTLFISRMSSNADGAKHLQAELEKIRDLEDFNLAHAFLNQMTGYVVLVEKEIASMSAQEAQVKSAIDNIEKNLQTEKSEGGEKRMAALRVLMATAAKCSNILKRTLEEVQAINKAMPRVFGL